MCDELEQRVAAFTAAAKGSTNHANVDALAAELRLRMQTHPQERPRLGGALGRLLTTLKAPPPQQLDWLELGGGRLAIGHRPKLKDLPALRRDGVSHIWTLLAASEGAATIEAATLSAGLLWIWLPMANGDPPAEDRRHEFSSLFGQVREVLAAGGSVYLHCAAGIHRTGMIAFALLRYLGQAHDTALGSLLKLRAITANGVGERRLTWGDPFGGAPA